MAIGDLGAALVVAAGEAERGDGAAAPAQRITMGSPLDISYHDIANGVRMVTQFSGSWTVYLYDHQNRLVQLEFSSYAAARLFLDASVALAAQPPTTIEIASIKH